MRARCLLVAAACGLALSGCFFPADDRYYLPVPYLCSSRYQCIVLEDSANA